MKRIYFVGAASVLFSTGPLLAGGVERSGQFLGPLFEDGNYVELSFAHVSPGVKGLDRSLGPAPGGASTGNVLESYNNWGLAYKQQLNKQWSVAVMFDQPFGADVLYASSSVNLGGTSANISSQNVTGIVRYEIPNSSFGVHGGLRVSRADGNVTLGGVAFDSISGYHLSTDRDMAYGWLAGASWERPEIGARVALTYNSAVEHEFQAVESGPLVDFDGPGSAPALPLLDGTSMLKVSTPKSWNLEFQTGVSENTLIFGSVRLADWSSFRIDPVRLWQVTGGGLVDLDDTITYTLGVGHRFSDRWSGAVSFSFEEAGSKEVSPLAPTNGYKSVGLAAIYTQGKMRITTGITYVSIGNALPSIGTPATVLADLNDSHAWGVGVKIGFNF